MMHKLFSWIFPFSLMLNLALVVSSCSWNKTIDTLVLTSYNDANNESGYDYLITQELKNEGKSVATVYLDSGTSNYAQVLTSLLNDNHSIVQVYVLDQQFYIGLINSQVNNSLMKVINIFNNVNFYLFNSNLNETQLSVNNLYQFNLNKDKNQIVENYGTLIANNFYSMLSQENNNYLFATDKNGNKIVKIGFIKDKSLYQNDIKNQFKTSLSNLFKNNNNFTFQFYCINNNHPLVDNYNNYNNQLALQYAQSLYAQYHVNFILNTNSWYNNVISFATSNAAKNTHYTTKFISSNVVNINNYFKFNSNVLMFSYYLDYSFLNYSLEQLKKYEIFTNSYDINSNIKFVNNIGVKG